MALFKLIDVVYDIDWITNLTNSCLLSAVVYLLIINYFTFLEEVVHPSQSQFSSSFVNKRLKEVNILFSLVFLRICWN